MAKVYYSKEISPEALIQVYDHLNSEFIVKTGRDFASYAPVGIKVSTGERGARGYLKSGLIGPLTQKLQGTIVECNTAYAGSRNSTEEHLQLAAEHGFTRYASVDIMDSEGEIELPVPNGKHLQKDIVGSHLDNYGALLNLAHGKGHAMGGFGANLKNQAIGIASRRGKAYIHTCGQTASPEEMQARLEFDEASGRYYDRDTSQRDFIESMAEAAGAVCRHFAEQGKPIFYITVMNFLSVDCDCAANQSDPILANFGIVGSTDPVANDQAFIDFIWGSSDPGALIMRDRIETRDGRHILEYAEQLGLGSRQYDFKEL